MSLQTERTTVKRVPKNANYDEKAIHEILDAGKICHISFNYNEQVYSIPTIYGRHENQLYIHGASTSRMLQAIQEQSICLNVTLVDGLVLARSAFHHSMNYRSVILLGKASLVENREEKINGLYYISEQVLKGRWDEVRPPNEKELKATHVFRFPIVEGAAKVRTGAPKDEKQDMNLDVWAGVLPLSLEPQALEEDPLLKSGIPIPKSVNDYLSTINKKA